MFLMLNKHNKQLKVSQFCTNLGLNCYSTHFFYEQDNLPGGQWADLNYWVGRWANVHPVNLLFTSLVQVLLSCYGEYHDTAHI